MPLGIKANLDMYLPYKLTTKFGAIWGFRLIICHPSERLAENIENHKVKIDQNRENRVLDP